MTIIVDDTTSLELVNERHAESIYNLANASRAQLREWLPWIDYMQSVDFIKSFISDSQKRAEEKSDLAYVVICKDAIVGRIGVYKIDWQNKSGSIGYWIGNEFQGNGLITKSCKALLDHCFNTLELNRIEIRCGTENHRSKGIPERLNFKKEGIIRQGELIHDKFIDLYCYSMLREEWTGLNH